MELDGIDLRLLAQVVGASMNVEIKVEGTSFATDGKDVFIPESWGIAADKDSAIFVRGGICHVVVGHLRHTSFDVWGRAKADSRLVASLFNILEDIRIERLAFNVYPGARSILSEMIGKMDQLEFFGHADGSIDGLESYLIKWLRHDYLGQPVVKDASDFVRDYLGDACFDDVCKLAFLAASTSVSSHDILNFAQQIAARLEYERNNPQSDEQNQANDSGQGDGQSDEQNQASDSGRTISDEISIQNQGGGFDIPTMINRLDKNLFGSNLAGKMEVKNLEDSATSCQEDSYQEDVEYRNLALMMRSRLREDLRSYTEDEDDSLSDRGRLDVSMIPSALCGAREVFVEDGKVGIGLDTSVFLLVDRSGSTNTIFAELKSISNAIASALSSYEGDGVEFGFGFFNYRLVIAKRGHERYSEKIKNRLRTVSASGGTNWYGAFQEVFPLLLKSRKRRKVLITVTDGDMHFLADAFRSADFAGIELAFLAFNYFADDAALREYLLEHEVSERRKSFATLQVDNQFGVMTKKVVDVLKNHLIV